MATSQEYSNKSFHFPRRQRSRRDLRENQQYQHRRPLHLLRRNQDRMQRTMGANPMPNFLEDISSNTRNDNGGVLEILPEALMVAMSHVINELRDEWQRDLELIRAQSREQISQMRVEL